jgi:pyruvate dehydrogenase E1 component alpha subunit
MAQAKKQSSPKTDPLGGLTTEELVDFYREMQRIRVFEEKSAEQYTRGRIRGFLHLYIGEEAIAVGTMASLDAKDYVITHYRDHGQAMARGVSAKAMMAELFGKVTGTSRGKGGSMHIFDVEKNFLGGWAIVGGQLPLATGLALASNFQKDGRITVVYFGDGALNQGEFHEAFNLAALWKLPVLFFLENNQFGMGTHVDRSYAGGHAIYQAANHYKMPSRQIDGMNVVTVYEAVKEIADYIRAGNGPYFLEALCYRFRGHSMADPQQYRSSLDLDKWLPKDPIPNLKRALVQDRRVPEATFAKIDADVETEMNDAVEFAEKSPLPEPADLYRDIEADDVNPYETR